MKKKKAVKKTVYRMPSAGGECCWGNKISWEEPEQFNTKSKRFTIVGINPRVPLVGDFLLSKMKSGKVAVFTFEQVTKNPDPPDLFFATVSFIGYEDEVKHLLPEDERPPKKYLYT